MTARPPSEPVRVRIKAGWHGAGQTGDKLADVATGARVWSVVVWDDDDEPELHKSEGLEHV